MRRFFVTLGEAPQSLRPYVVTVGNALLLAPLKRMSEAVAECDTFDVKSVKSVRVLYRDPAGESLWKQLVAIKQDPLFFERRCTVYSAVSSLCRTVITLGPS